MVSKWRESRDRRTPPSGSADLDGNTAERLLDGMDPDDAPPGYAAVAQVLAAASAPVRDADLSGAGPALAAFRDTVGQAHVRNRAFAAFAHTVSGKIAIGAAAFMLFLGGGTAVAATGSLPGPAQDVVARALDSVGISVPRPASNTTGHTGTDNRSDNVPVGNAPAPNTAIDPPDRTHGADVSDKAKSVEPGPGHGSAVCDTASNGKCKPSHTVRPTPPAAQGPDTEAPRSPAANHGADVSDKAKSVEPGTERGSGHGSAVCDTASNGKCKPSQQKSAG